MTPFAAGCSVRLVGEPTRVGVATGRTKQAGGLCLEQVTFPGQQRWVPSDQLELVPDQPESPFDLLRHGRHGRAADLYRALTHIRLSGRLANFIYSLEVTDTDFYAYQFKPVLKLLQSSSTGILVADEVGLGKTIEAGLLWTELRTRFDLQRLLVLCPAMLRHKWARELRRRFGVKAQVCGAGELLETLRQARAQDVRDYAIVASFQGTRPSDGWDTREEPSDRDRLARLLDESAQEAPLVDLLVIDEAHYLRNPETRTFEFGMLARRSAQYALLLSATPVHLHSDDLFTLLRVVDEDVFNQRQVFEYVREANARLVTLRDRVLGGLMTAASLRAELEAALRHELLRNSRQLSQLAESVDETVDLRSQRTRVDIASRLESANLLGYAVSRTRRREVAEWRAVREAVTLEVEMSELERDFYEQVTAIVRDYCDSRRQSEGFLLVMPQRQVASSLAAARLAWLEQDEDVAEEVWEELGIELPDAEAGGLGPVVSAIRAGIGDGPSLAALTASDTKYERLRQQLQAFLREHSAEKVVVFSSFRTTLRYLQGRLRADGITSALLLGGSADQQEVLEAFASAGGPSVLLSSEVGSEGIDLQFAWVLVNYDLPWNPMKVEQRIGRLDRLGQNSDRVVIWNLVHAGTIDERIYNRLLLRLGIFRHTLGDLEVVLGDRIRELTRDLMRPGLTPEQEIERIDQTALALENVRIQEESLEQDASSLVAYGDYILRQVSEARALSRRIRSTDVQRYVSEFLESQYPGTRLVQDAADPTVLSIQLSPQAKADLDAFVRRARISTPTTLTRNDPAPVRCRFNEKLKVAQFASEEVINQVHPLVRFVAQALDALQSANAPAIAARVAASAFGPELADVVSPGDYCLVVTRWVFEALRVNEQLWFGVARLHGAPPLEPEQAERFVTTLAERGEDWVVSEEHGLCASAADAAEHTLLPKAWEDFRLFKRNLQAQNEDRANAQLASLETHLRHQRDKFEALRARYLAQGNPGLARAQELNVERLAARIEREKVAIDAKRQLTANLDEVAVGVVRVYGAVPVWVSGRA